MIVTLIAILIACVIARWIILSLAKTAVKVKRTWEKESKKEEKKGVM